MLGFRTGRWLTVAALTVTLGCGGDGGASPGSGGESDDSNDKSGTTKKDGGAPSKDAGGGSKSSDASAPGSGTGKQDAGGDKASTGDNIPCDIQQLVVSKCGACHGAKTSGGAPMSLTKLADFHAPAPTDKTRTVDEVGYERMTETDPTKRMPPTSQQISTADAKTLEDWLKAGAPGSSDQCDAPSTGASDAGAGAPADSKSGVISITPLVYDDPDLKCYKFLGFAKSGDKTQKYSVPTTPDYYVDFTIKPPFKGVQYLKYYTPIIDNAAVLHHWLFYQNGSAGTEGVTENAVGIHPDGDLIAGWAPGGDPMYFAADTGLQISGDATFQIEMHYNNKTGKPSPDASGLELCVTPNKPKNVAALAWLGTDSISGTSATGNCKPSTTGPVHLIAGQPHMHLKGRHMKVVHTKKDGSTETIHDDDFDFNYQREYITDVLVNPGDSIQTTCTYSGPATFGKGTNDEMCYFFSVHWPAGGLAMQGSGTFVHGGNSCLP